MTVGADSPGSKPTTSFSGRAGAVTGAAPCAASCAKDAPAPQNAPPARKAAAMMIRFSFCSMSLPSLKLPGGAVRLTQRGRKNAGLGAFVEGGGRSVEGDAPVGEADDAVGEACAPDATDAGRE